MLPLCGQAQSPAHPISFVTSYDLLYYLSSQLTPNISASLSIDLPGNAPGDFGLCGGAERPIAACMIRHAAEGIIPLRLSDRSPILPPKCDSPETRPSGVFPHHLLVVQTYPAIYNTRDLLPSVELRASMHVKAPIGSKVDTIVQG